jgi:hypothetical protein
MLMVRFLKNSRYNFRVVLKAQGRERSRLPIVSFAPFHPLAKSTPGFGWGVMKFIWLDRTADP